MGFTLPANTNATERSTTVITLESNALSPVSVRPATEADREFLRRLHHRAYRAVVEEQFGSWDERAQDGWFAKGLPVTAYTIIEHLGVPVGAAAVQDARDQIEIVEIQVLPEWQGRQIGTRYVSEQLERARVRGVPVRLRVLRLNRARELYERLGFHVVHELPDHLGMIWVPTPVGDAG
jgi:ribosomal protein S18 acetylase RimI-like enzyme